MFSPTYSGTLKFIMPSQSSSRSSSTSTGFPLLNASKILLSFSRGSAELIAVIARGVGKTAATIFVLALVIGCILQSKIVPRSLPTLSVYPF